MIEPLECVPDGYVMASRTLGKLCCEEGAPAVKVKGLGNFIFVPRWADLLYRAGALRALVFAPTHYEAGAETSAKSKPCAASLARSSVFRSVLRLTACDPELQAEVLLVYDLSGDEAAVWDLLDSLIGGAA